MTVCLGGKQVKDKDRWMVSRRGRLLGAWLPGAAGLALMEADGGACREGVLSVTGVGGAQRILAVG
jgi:hypothetical protein